MELFTSVTWCMDEVKEGENHILKRISITGEIILDKKNIFNN